jgi:hypothetical protein
MAVTFEKITDQPSLGAIAFTHLLSRFLADGSAADGVAISALAASIFADAALTGNPTAPTQSAGNNSTRIATTAFVEAGLAGKEALGLLAGVNTQASSYILVLTDIGKVLEMNNGSANNLTVPLNATVAFPIGSRIDITQIGAGQTTIVATGGVTIRQREGKLKLAGQYAGASLYKRATDEWVLFGDLTT